MSWEIGAPCRRVITDNDYCGDPDGVVQLAHHLLCPTVDIRAVIGSPAAGGGAGTAFSADASVDAAREVAARAGRRDVSIVSASNEELASPSEPRTSAAADVIVAEAMRDDTDLPLFVTCGGGLTSIASAWLLEPRIADRLTLVWIGGREHEGFANAPPGALAIEYNTSIDLLAAQVVFNDSDLAIWQVPRDAYTQVVASRSELFLRMRPHGPLGEHLYNALGAGVEAMTAFGLDPAEAYVLGDSPLVLLTALWPLFNSSPVSCRWTERPRPRIDDAGGYDPNPDGPPFKLFTQLDSRLVLEDLYAKLELHAAA
jgi:inosine-uridine preferring nucleoside hydrolase